jgi:Lon protease-like protein
MKAMPADEYELALFPLNTVLFPTTFLPLRIFEPRYVDLIGRCMRDNMGFGVIAITTGTETGRAAQTHATGTLARIVDFDQGDDGLLNIVSQGAQRFRLLDSTVHADNLLVGRVSNLADVAQAPIPEDCHYLASILAEIVANTKTVQRPGPAPVTASQLAYGLAQYLPLKLPAKVELLETENALILLKRLSNDVRRLRQAPARDA